MEWIIAFAISAGINIWGFFELGQTNAERERYKVIADDCEHNRNEERANTIADANSRAIKESKAKDIIASHRNSLDIAMESTSNSCLSTPIGDVSSGLLDAERRLLEELRANRVQP